MILLLPLLATAILTITQPSGLGVSIGWQRGDAWRIESLEVLHPPVWKNWLWDHAGEPGYIPQVYSMRDSTLNRSAMVTANNVGGVWILGSEPELEGSYISPKVAAAFMRSWDEHTTVEWGAPGIITWPGGYQWLGEYLAAAGPVGDYWHIHLYDVYTPDDWERKWDEWKQWMVDHNLVRPTIISETAGWDASVDQAGFLDRITEIQAHDPLLQVVLWYSDQDYWGLWTWADMRDGNGLTALGEHYVGTCSYCLPVTPEPVLAHLYIPLANR